MTSAAARNLTGLAGGALAGLLTLTALSSPAQELSTGTEPSVSSETVAGPPVEVELPVIEISTADPTATALSTSAVAPAPAAAMETAPEPTASLARARKLYFSGDVAVAAAAFESAVKKSSEDVTAWLDGSIAWAEAGEPEKSVRWAERAAALAPNSAGVQAALGWSLLRTARPADADECFRKALSLDKDFGWAVLGHGRAELALGHPESAAADLHRAEGYAIQQTLASFYLGRAEEARGDAGAAGDAYRRAIVSDVYFHEGRDPLTRAYIRQKRYADAWRQLERLSEAEPSGRITRALVAKLKPLFARPRFTRGSRPESDVSAAPADAEASGSVPMIRVGVGTTPMGKPRARTSLTVRGSTAWRAFNPKTGKTIVECRAQESWTIHIVRPKTKRGSPRLEMRGPDGQVRAAPDLLNLEPLELARGTLQIEDDPERGGPGLVGRSLRGTLEVALRDRRRGLRVVDIVDLEDYTAGVVGAEMPSSSPLEALKAQAIIARTVSLFIKTVRHRHAKDGYDICDEQHCQVYAGLRVENDRTRAAVSSTRGRILRYKGRVAQPIFSSNCGGSTQSGVDIGWGDIPYWGRVADSPHETPPPTSPLELRRFLSTWPDTYCRPSGMIHPSHSRWTRVIPAQELEDRLNRKLHIGKLRALRVGRRAPSGHVEALIVVGSRRKARLTNEFDIRSLLGAGSLRSTLFVVDTEYKLVPGPATRKKGRPVPASLTPEAFVFRGGGWGHGVGLCQSGAMGRAEAGQTFDHIMSAYFPGVELSSLDYD